MANSPGASVARGAVMLLGVQPITWAASLALVMFLPRYLGDEALGEATILMTISNLAAAVASLGVPDFLVRHVSTRSNRSDTHTGAAFLLLLASSVAIAVLLSGITLVWNPSTPRPVFVLITMVAVVFMTAQTAIMSLVRGQERHVPYALLGVASGVTSVVLGLGVLALGGGLAGYIVSNVVSAVLLTFAVVRVADLRLRRSDFDLARWKQVARGGLPFLGTNLTSTIRNQADRLLLAALASAPAVGWYAAAWRVVSIPVFVPTLIVTPLLPALSRCADDREVFTRTLHRSVQVIMVLTFPFSAMLVAVAPIIPQVLHWDVVFDHSVPMIAILACQMLLIGPNMAFGTALTALHRERHFLAIMVSAAVIDLSLNLVLIPAAGTWWQNGGLGATLATMLTEVFIMLCAVTVLPRQLKLWRLVPSAARLVLIFALQVLVVRLVLPSSLPLAVTGGCVVWAIGVLLLREVRLSDLDSARQIIAGRLSRVTRRASSVAPSVSV